MLHLNLYPAPTMRTSLIAHLSSPFQMVVFLSIFLLSLLCQASRLDAQTIQRSEPRALTGHENHHITMNDAASLTRNFRNSTGNDQSTILGEFFGRDALVASLSQAKCIGLRIYYGKRDDGTPVLVFVGVDGSGKDMVNGLIGEYGLICPPICDEQNRLTGDDDVATTTTSGLSVLGTLVRPK